jgi:hypothetical protein
MLTSLGAATDRFFPPARRRGAARTDAGEPYKIGSATRGQTSRRGALFEIRRTANYQHCHATRCLSEMSVATTTFATIVKNERDVPLV